MKRPLDSTQSIAFTAIVVLSSACSGVVGRESPSGAATDKPPAASPSSGRAHNLNSLGLSEVNGSWDLELRELANAELGYAISMPSAWLEVPVTDETGSATGVQGFAFPGVTSSLGVADPVLTVSIGDPSGSVSLCLHPRYCSTITARTLDELEAALAEVDGMVGVGWPDTRVITELAVTPTTVGGEPARVRSRLPENQVTGPPWLYSLFLVHDGRPVIVGLDYTSVNDLIGIDVASRILASLRFLD